MKNHAPYGLMLVLSAICFGCAGRYGCPRDTRTDLVKLLPETRSWFNYVKGQSITFQDEGGNADVVTVIQYTDTTESYFQGDECPERPGEVIRTKLVLPSTADTVTITGEYGNQLNAMKAPINLTYFTDTGRVFPDNQPGNYSYSAALTLGTQQFTNVVKASCSACAPTGLTALYMAKSVGLVAFVKSGKLWIRK